MTWAQRLYRGSPLATDGLVANPPGLGAFFAQAAFLVGFVFLVVPREEYYLRVALEGEDMRGDAVEEPAVVADHQHATGEFQQGVFQGAQGFHV